MRPPTPAVETFGQDSFLANFLAWYEIRIGDNSIVFANDSCNANDYGGGGDRNINVVATSKRRTVLGDLTWVRNGDPRLTVLKTTRENLDPVVDLRFPIRSVRWLTLRAFPLRDYEVAEFEIYGEGYVQEATYLTPILDFGQAVTWGKIRWEGEVPDGTRIEIRTRTGHTPDPLLYFAPNTNDDLVSITRAQYDKNRYRCSITSRLRCRPLELLVVALRVCRRPAQSQPTGQRLARRHPAAVAGAQPLHPTRHQALCRLPCSTPHRSTHLAVERNPVGAGARRRNLAD